MVTTHDCPLGAYATGHSHPSLLQEWCGEICQVRGVQGATWRAWGSGFGDLGMGFWNAPAGECPRVVLGEAGWGQGFPAGLGWTLQGWEDDLRLRTRGPVMAILPRGDASQEGHLCGGHGVQEGWCTGVALLAGDSQVIWQDPGSEPVSMSDHTQTEGRGVTEDSLVAFQEAVEVSDRPGFSFLFLLLGGQGWNLFSFSCTGVGGLHPTPSGVCGPFRVSWLVADRHLSTSDL